MNIVAIVTLGTSDIQFNENSLGDFKLRKDDNIELVHKSDHNLKVTVRKNRGYPSYLLHECRRGALSILDKYKTFEPVLQFPLTMPFFEKVLNDSNYKLQKIIWICTNQQDEHQRKNDSIFVADVIQKYLNTKFGLNDNFFKKLEITENLTDYDYQYKFFSDILNSNDNEFFACLKSTEKIFLLPQGGIDQINTTLMLQLIRYYGTKVEVYQTRENELTKRISFAELYTRDLIFNDVKLLCQKARYSSAKELLSIHFANQYNEIVTLLNLADTLLKLRFEDLSIFKNAIIPIHCKAITSIVKRDSDYNPFLCGIFDDKSFAFKILVSFEKARFYHIINQDDDFVLSLQIFIENFLNYYISQILGISYSNVIKENEFNKIIEDNKNDLELKSKIYCKLTNINKNSLPVKILLAYKQDEIADTIITYFMHLNNAFNNCKIGLDTIRNNLVHKGKSPTQQQIAKVKSVFRNIETSISKSDPLFLNLNTCIAKELAKASNDCKK